MTSLPSRRDAVCALTRPFRALWNERERRPRAAVRLAVGVCLVFLFAAVGSQFRTEPLGGGGPVVDAVDGLIWVLPQAVCITLGVAAACLVLDRRRVADLGLAVGRGWWRGLAGGTALGAGITVLGVAVGLATGSVGATGARLTGGPLVWPVLAVAAAAFQLLFVVPEELFARGYVVTNVVEGFEGVPAVPRPAAAGVGVVVASLLFYVTHAGRGATFGVMAGGVAVLLGVGYVLSGDLSVPVGIHFGFNVAGVLLGTNPQSASLLRLTAAGSVAESLELPAEMVAVRLAGAAVGVVLLVLWYRDADGRVRVARSLARPTLRWRGGD